MPNISDLPIDWASVNWLYVAVLSSLVFFVDPDQHVGFPQCCDFGPVVCGRLRILDLLSARPAAPDIGNRPEGAGHASRCRRPECSGDARRSGHTTFFAAGQLAIDTVRCIGSVTG